MNAELTAPAAPSTEAADLAEVYKHAKRNCHLCRGAGYFRVAQPAFGVVERYFILPEVGRLVLKSANVGRRTPLERLHRRTPKDKSREAAIKRARGIKLPPRVLKAALGDRAEKETCACALRRAEKALRKAQAQAEAAKAVPA